MGRKETEKKGITFRELKEAVNAMDDAQLDLRVLWAGDERGGVVHMVDILQEDHINPSGDCWEPRSVCLDPIKEQIEGFQGTSEELADLKAELEDYESEPVVGVKGQGVLVVDL
jgi:hypothetical protein